MRALNKIFIVAVIALFVVFGSKNGYAQSKLDKANHFFEHFEYAKAIPIYEKYLKNNQDTLALSRLGFCLIQTNHYDKAEGVYKELIDEHGADPIYHFYYAESLKNNHKFEEAKQEYHEYAEKVPNDASVQRYIRGCERILSKADALIGVELYNLEGINTDVSEFGAFFYEDGVAFTSDRDITYHLDDNHGWTGRPYYSMYYASMDTKDTSFSKIKLLDGEMYNDFHNGPATFHNETNTIYFTRIEKKQQKQDGEIKVINRAKIYSIDLSQKKHKLEAFEYNDDSYSVAHPSITPDGKYLFFSSDMPGGEGGQDIYFCTKADSGWGKPINLGTEVNTFKDEVFPYAKSGKSIYFSSEGHVGFGGLDVYSTTQLGGRWTLVNNLKDPINSPRDDFSIAFRDNNTGIISSDRKGGLGKDDIYLFSIHRRIISGNLYTDIDSLPHNNKLVKLKNSRGEIVDSTRTNEQGYFELKNLDPNETYSLMLDEDDDGYRGFMENSFYKKKDRIKVYLAAKTGGIVDSLLLESNEFFEYSNLEPEQIDPNIEDLFDVNFNTDDSPVAINGTVFNLKGETRVASSNVTVYLKNSTGFIIDMIKTDENGFYEFRNLPDKQDYILFLEEDDIDLSTGSKYLLEGKVYHPRNPDKKPKDIQLMYGGKFNNVLVKMFLGLTYDYQYEILPTDFYGLPQLALEDTDLEIDQDKKKLFKNEKVTVEGRISYGENTPAKNYTIYLKSKYGKLISETQADEFGKFKIQHLPSDEGFVLSLDEEDIDLRANLEHKIIGEVYYEDSLRTPVYDIEFYFGGVKRRTIIEYFDGLKRIYNFQFLPSDYYGLDDMLADDSDLIIPPKKEYTLAISGRISRGNNVPAIDYTVYLRTTDGAPIKEVQTDQYGKFIFTGLEKQGYSLALDEADIDLNANEEHRILGEAYLEDPEKTPAYDIELYFAGIKKKKLIKYFDNLKKSYSFQFLPSDYYGLDQMAEEDTWLEVLEEGTTGQATSYVTENITYAYDSWEILKVDYPKLDKLVNFLKSNPNVKLEIYSHTDSRGAANYNLNLSKKRAKSVYNYLVSKDIDSNRLKYEGFGESRLANSCKDGLECSEDQHEQNRRTEFKIVWK